MPADILSASLAERLRAHAGAVAEIATMVKTMDSSVLRNAVQELTMVAARLEWDAFEAPREAKP